MRETLLIGDEDSDNEQQLLERPTRKRRKQQDVLACQLASAYNSTKHILSGFMSALVRKTSYTSSLHLPNSLIWVYEQA